MNDLIDRQEAIKEVLKGQLSEDDSLVESVEECNSMIEWAADVLKNLPSAQPDCADCKKHGGDWECDYNTCHKGMDTISRQQAIDALREEFKKSPTTAIRAMSAINGLPVAESEIIRCHQCGFWDRDTLQHNFNDFRDWNEAECLVLAERDGYHEINRYTEADDFCSYAERRAK